MKRFLLLMITLFMAMFIVIPQADARRRGRSGRRGRHGRSSRHGRGARYGRNRSADSFSDGAEFFGKPSKWRSTLKIIPSNRPGPSGYILNTDYVTQIHNAIKECL